MTGYGVIFPKVPYVLSNDSDMSLIWTIVALILRVELFQREIATHVKI